MLNGKKYAIIQKSEETMYNLLTSYSFVLDIAFFVIILIGLVVGVARGFIKGVCKWAGTIASVFLAVTFCNPFQRTLDGWFSLTQVLMNAINNEKLAGWLALAISFLIILIGAKLGFWLLGKIGTALVEKIKVFATINRLLGGILGLLESLVLIFLLLMICKWINAEVVNEFIYGSTIVSKIYGWEWFQWASTLPFLPGR